MPLSAWIMLIIGCLLLYGGLGICLVIASRGRN
ncbi:MetS family NSS transporter small subunit [bacterium]|nr:MetS family NSS transporter small subunit [candidate division CSSED10-310 bacterium]